MPETNFVNGMRVSRHERAPSFVVANIGIKVDDFVVWLRENQQGEWTNLDIKISKSGKYYAELNTYEKKAPVRDEVEKNQGRLNNIDVVKEKNTKTSPNENGQEISIEDIPF